MTLSRGRLLGVRWAVLLKFDKRNHRPLKRRGHMRHLLKVVRVKAFVGEHAAGDFVELLIGPTTL